MNEEYKAAIGAGIFISIIIAVLGFVYIMAEWLDSIPNLDPATGGIAALLLGAFVVTFFVALLGGMGD